MTKRLFGSVLCCLLVIFTSSCGKNNNIFSWAHRSGSGSYDSLISDADSEMRNQNYAEAAKDYFAAAKLRPGDKEAVMRYTSAVIHDTLDSEITNTVTKMITDKTSRLSLDFTALSPEKISKTGEALSNLVNNENMFPQLFEGENPPTDTSTNLDGATAYALEGIFSAAKNPEVKQYVGSTFPIDISNLPPKSSASPAVESAVHNMKAKALKAMNCLNNIKDKSQDPIIEGFKSELNNTIHNSDLWLGM
ncbi:MAG: hypothetical protein LE180_03330 [Endomicrobium sp.]|uniref:hypothetical protein n=1 Tax=Candidatus Endomicrobiellum pyrsonymphae TaxID=1408203 RepID=UPI003576A164|nr:hypothetical protein [Endomicrobium sp.]